MEPARLTPLALVARFGPHPATALGLALDSDEALGRWLVAACLLASQRDEARALRALSALEARGLREPAGLARSDPRELERLLAGAGAARPDRVAGLLWRASRALLEGSGGSLDRLAAGCEGLEALAARLAGLAPGLGRATLALFLQPLRERWPAAGELPLAPAARAAAVHLGWLRAGQDEEGEPGALRAALRREAPGVALADAEAALERLGRRACLRGRPERCLLGTGCPQMGLVSAGDTVLY